MTMTTDAVAKVAHPDTPVTMPTRQVVIEAIMNEGGCGQKKADQFLSYIERVVNTARCVDYDPVLVEGQDYRSFHRRLCLIMPDDAAATPGSAHDLIERFVLSPAHGELGVTHNQDGGDCILEITVQHV